jgi:N-acetylmuramoyl-L-alanine amidase
VGPRQSTERLRARLLKDAVEDNLDTIHSRLPAPLRPWRRFVRLWSPRVLRVAFPVFVVVTWTAATRWPSAPRQAPTQPVRPPRAASASGPASTVAPDLSPVSSGVLSLAVRRVVIDAGHGGSNLGASSDGGLLEKQLTLDIAERTRALVAARGFETVMTRTADETLSLEQRASTANGQRGDIFVSIHLNSLKPSTICGIETYYLGASSSPELDPVAAAENQHSGYSLSHLRSLLEKIYVDARRDESRRLADSVQRALLRTMRQTEPALTNRGVKTAPFVVLSATEMPAILAEVSCLSNQAEAERLRSVEHRQAIAGALLSGIDDFAND